MDPPGEQRSARMRHLHEDDNLVFPKRPSEPVTFDVDSSRHAKVFSDDVMSGSDLDMCARTSQTKARFLVIGAFCCFFFLLVTVSIYSSLNEQNNMDSRAMEENDGAGYGKEFEEEIFDGTILDGDEDQITSRTNTEIGVLPGHVTEGGDTINSIEFDDDLNIPDIELVDDDTNDVINDGVIAKGDGISDIASDDGNQEVFVMEVNGIKFEIGIGADGAFDLPEGLILNPHVRQHWAIIQQTLGLDYYDDDDTIVLEPPLSSEDDNKNEEINKYDGAEPAKVQAVRMPEGLLFEAPSTDEHVHGEGCDPVSVDVNDKISDLAAGDDAIEENP